MLVRLQGAKMLKAKFKSLSSELGGRSSRAATVKPTLAGKGSTHDMETVASCYSSFYLAERMGVHDSFETPRISLSLSSKPLRAVSSNFCSAR